MGNDVVNTASQIKELFTNHGEKVQIGKAWGIFSKGWLSIKDNGDFWHVMYINGKDTHQPLSGPALAADFLKASGERKIGPMNLTGSWKSALSMWPVKDEREATLIFEIIKNYVGQAHRFNC